MWRDLRLCRNSARVFSPYVIRSSSPRRIRAFAKRTLGAALVLEGSDLERSLRARTCRERRSSIKGSSFSPGAGTGRGADLFGQIAASVTWTAGCHSTIAPGARCCSIRWGSAVAISRSGRLVPARSKCVSLCARARGPCHRHRRAVRRFDGFLLHAERLIRSARGLWRVGSPPADRCCRPAQRRASVVMDHLGR